MVVVRVVVVGVGVAGVDVGVGVMGSRRVVVVRGGVEGWKSRGRRWKRSSRRNEC